MFIIVTGIRYTISTGDRNGFFRIDQDTGSISTAKQLDHDQHPFLILGITADIGSTPLFGTTQVRLPLSCTLLLLVRMDHLFGADHYVKLSLN